MTDHRDTVVVKDGGSSAGMMLGIILLIVVLAGGWYLFLGPGAEGNAAPGDVDVNVELPVVPPGTAAPEAS